MDCPECGAPTAIGTVPAAVREHAPGASVAVCTRCLSVTATSEPSPADAPDLGQVSTALPGDEVGALAVVLAADLLSSLATNREAIESLLAIAEGRGVDPVLTLERLAMDQDLSPDADLGRRVDQLDQLRS